MRVIHLTPDDADALVDRLATYDSMSALPRCERAWLVGSGELRSYEVGEKVVEVPAEAEEFVIILTGCVVVYVGHGAGRRHAMPSAAGSLTGLLPYSRLKRPPSDILVEEPVELLAIHKSRFPEMIHECPVLTESLVHAMLDRARGFAAANWEDEKVTSLGRLAAGLSHELNNPAAAAASGAQRLSRVLTELADAAHAVGAAGLTGEQLALVAGLVERCRRPARPALGALERADLEEHLGEWLEGHGLGVDDAATLVEAGVGVEMLEPLVSELDGAALVAAVRWITAAAVGAVVTADVERATRRIHDVVKAVQGYTYMDRPPAREPTDVVRGISDTVEVLRAEANRKGARLHLDAAPGLPPISAVAPDLNQVWANLLHNAIDAVGKDGEVRVSVEEASGAVVVRIVDDGGGIAPEVQPRVFDPFFTTKGEGEGVGLGLDMVRRVVRSHRGDVEFESVPGRTEFRVRLPAS